jgi:hypothetical protein
MGQINFKLDEDKHNALREQALKENITIGGLVTRHVENALSGLCAETQCKPDEHVATEETPKNNDPREVDIYGVRVPKLTMNFDDKQLCERCRRISIVEPVSLGKGLSRHYQLWCRNCVQVGYREIVTP